MKNELKVLPDEVQEIALKVPESKQKEVQKVLNDIFTGTYEWEKKVDSIKVKDINDIMSIELANTARLNTKKARLSGEKIFDTKRAEVQLQMSDFKLEDALWLKSKQIMQLKFKHIEDKAKFKADFVKRYEAEQHELKVKDRLLKVRKFNPDVDESDIALLTDETFIVVLTGYKKTYNDKIEAEAKAEKERIEKERAEKERIAKIEADNIKLAKEKAEAEKERKRLAEIQAKKNAERIKKEQEAEAERQRIADELEAKRVAEIKANQQAELNKGDSAKVKDLISDLEHIKTKYSFKSAKNNRMYLDISILIDKIINHIK